MKQPSRPINVKLISYPVHPLATLFYVWEQSRSNNTIPNPEQIQELIDSEDDFMYDENSITDTAIALGAVNDRGIVCIKDTRERVWNTISQILDEDIPCTENLNFVFAIENMSISLREQMVRHRIGVTIGERTGIDIVPEIAKSSWWSQSTRVLSMERFFSEGRYILPSSLNDKVYIDDQGIHTTAEELYLNLLAEIEYVYHRLVSMGVPKEDARQIIPVGATHSITWAVNLKALIHIVGKRACWVIQANLWEGLISGMIDELCKHIHPIFRKIITPPCHKQGKYVSCPYFQVNKERVQGRDGMPPCPMWVYHEPRSAKEAMSDVPNSVWKCRNNKNLKDITKWECEKDVEMAMLHENIKSYERLWKLNVLTGQSL
jgi:thymidylate synthase (FAD)